ncbi:tetratricopeptide repeat protein, partial [Geobacillus thermodenitrificans]
MANLNEQGLAHMRAGEYEEALRCFSEAVNEHPDDPAGYINIGTVLAAAGEEEKALECFRQALMLD